MVITLSEFKDTIIWIYNNYDLSDIDEQKYDDINDSTYISPNLISSAISSYNETHSFFDADLEWINILLGYGDETDEETYDRIIKNYLNILDKECRRK